MTEHSTSPDDFLITLKPEATPEEEERFVSELARIMLAIARHVVARKDVQAGGEEQTADS